MRRPLNIAQRANRFLPGLYETLLRFPVPALCALGAAVFINLDLAKIVPLSSEQSVRTVTAFAAGFLAGGAANLALESHSGLPRPVSHLIAALTAGCIGAICFFDKLTAFDPWFLLPGLVLAVMCATYIGGKFKEDAFWLFNARFGLAIVLATIVVCIFCGGLSAILYSLKYLFEFNVKGVHHQHVWMTGIALFGPVYGLSLMPGRFDEVLVMPPADSLINRAVSILLNYILVPLLAIYIAILHFYAGKVLIQWELPKGQVGWMVLMFVLGGTASYLIARPWYERGTRLTRWFLDWWFAFLAIPIGLLAFGVGRRILDYGVTPERYGLVIIGFWAAALLVYWGLKGRHIASWNIVGVLGGLLLLTAFGPWGAVGYSISDQIHRLTNLLDRNNVLVDGKLSGDVDGAKNLLNADSDAAMSIVRFLNRMDAVDRLAPIFEGHSEDPFRGGTEKGMLVSALSRLFAPPSQMGQANIERIRHKANQKVTVKLDKPGRLTGPHYVNLYTRRPADSEESGEIVAWHDGKFLAIASGPRVWRAEIIPLIERIKQVGKSREKWNSAIVIDIPGASGVARLILLNADVRIKDEELQGYLLQFWTVLPN